MAGFLFALVLVLLVVMFFMAITIKELARRVALAVYALGETVTILDMLIESNGKAATPDILTKFRDINQTVLSEIKK